MPNIKLLRCRAIIIAWLLAFVAFIQVNAQKYFFDNYGTKQGLSEQKVYALLQDSKDYIWLGTANGVSRFDGKRFENFTTNDSLAPGGVRCITEDSLGNIWFGHLNGGISRYNGRQFEKAAFDSIVLKGDVTGIAQLNGKIWFASRFDGAVSADFPVQEMKKIRGRQYAGKDGLSDQVFDKAIIQDTSLVLVADAGLRRFNRQEDKFEIFRMPHMTTYFSSTCLMEDSRGDIWFGTYNGGIYRYKMSESKMQVIDLRRAGVGSNWVTSFAEDKKGRIWVGTWEGGVVMMNDSIPVKFDAGNGLAASRIYDVMEDVEGNILIADQDNGLTIYKGDAFITVSSGEVLPDLNVNAIYQDRTGDLWFGTNAGISRYAPGKKTLFYNEHSNSIFEYVTAFREDREGNLWIGSRDGGVMEYNMKTQHFESQPYINSTFPNLATVTAMEIDKKNNLWIGTVEGLIAGTIGQMNFVRRIVMDSLTVNEISALYNDPHGNMWIGTEASGDKPTLIKFDPVKDEFRKIPALKGIKPVAMMMDKKGVLWIGTSEGVRALRNDSIVTILRKDDGLLSDIVNLLAPGDDGSIYIGTNSGLNRYLPESGRIFSYTERNGFPGIETRKNAVYRSHSGDLWFGTTAGATRLTPVNASVDELEPLTHIMGIRVNYEPRDMVPGMKLSYNERSIIFDYYSICLTNPDVVSYKVKLEGADHDWQPVTDQTRATYTGLSSGKYTFMVMARNSQGVWNSDPVTYSFIIKPPFYFSWWFILLVSVVALIAVIAYIKIRERKLVKEKVILEEKVKERTAEVVQKSMEIEEKNRDITASIRYAERIQRAMLPRDDTFDETFVLFMPKDIVSGDFYWMYGNGDHQYIAVCDCTGHGVPGAFMSIIGHNSLNKVVREYGITRPSAILDQLNTEVLKALRQRNEEIINDGMDMALIAFHRKEFTLEFAGAYNPLYVVRNGELNIFKGDRFPIGMTAVDSRKSFTNQVVDIQPGDMLYMCSDGYADQFGSPEVKKYKSGNIRKLLSEIYTLPVCEQRKKIEEEILNWKGNLPQTDDILFIGTRIPVN